MRFDDIATWVADTDEKTQYFFFVFSTILWIIIGAAIFTKLEHDDLQEDIDKYNAILARLSEIPGVTFFRNTHNNKKN